MPDVRLALVVGAKLRILRARAGLSQAAVAERMDSYREIVARIEAGHHDQELETIWTYCAAVDANPLEVFAEVDAAIGLPRGGESHAGQRRKAAPSARRRAG